MYIGQIAALALRTGVNTSPHAVDAVQAISGAGLRDDVHAAPRSPRQLLLAGAPAYDRLGLPPHALRENLLLDIDTASLRSGTVLQVGEQVLLRLTFQCEACGQLDLHQPWLSQQIGAQRGMLARVVGGGRIERGAPVLDLGMQWPAWSDDWRERLAQVLDAVPAGAVVDYKHLARLAGVQSSYCRAFPGVIARLGARYAGKAVAAASPSIRPRWQGDGLFDQRLPVQT